MVSVSASIPPAPRSARARAPLTVALWQTAYADADAPACSPQGMAQTLAQLEAAAARARTAGAQLLVTPEMALTGYHRDPDWLRAVAQPSDGAWAQAVAGVARRHGLAVVYGYPQAAPGGQKPYNAAQAMGPDGRSLLNYRKARLFGAVDAERFTEGPAGPATFHHLGWCLGMLICYDVECADTVQALAQAGADAVLVPTANMPEYDSVQQELLPRFAGQYGMHLVYANACGAETALAPGLAYGGWSTVVNPRGEVVARAGREPALLVTTLQV